MRVPMILRDTVNPYLAARAVFLLIRHGRFMDDRHYGSGAVSNAVKSVALPGLGTGVGQVSPENCATQVRAAIEEFVLDRKDFPCSWTEASVRHQLLYTDAVRDLQRPE